MKSHEPDWNDIRLFLAVAQAGSLSAAARQERLGEPLAELLEDRWLLVHADLKRVPRIRRTIDALARLFEDDAVCLVGASG